MSTDPTEPLVDMCGWLPTPSYLNLPCQQIPDHLPACDESCSPQSVQVQSAEKAIGESEWKHARNKTLCKFQRPTATVHLVLLNIATAEMVHTAFRVFLHDKAMRRCCPLCTFDDMEVIIRCMTTSVACERRWLMNEASTNGRT